MNVEELINELKELPPETIVQLGVYYDNCCHIQSVKKTSYFKDGEWVTILGDKKGEF